MSNTTLNDILKLLTGFLDAWKSYLNTRTEAYIRNRDKRLLKAIESAENIFLNMDVDWINDLLHEIEISKESDYKWREMKKKYNYYKKRFFKYNN